MWYHGEPERINSQEEVIHNRNMNTNNITVLFFSLYEFWCLFKEVYIFARQMGVSAVLTLMKKNLSHIPHISLWEGKNEQDFRCSNSYETNLFHIVHCTNPLSRKTINSHKSIDKNHQFYVKETSSCYAASQRNPERLETFLKYKNVVFNGGQEKNMLM